MGRSRVKGREEGEGLKDGKRGKGRANGREKWEGKDGIRWRGRVRGQEKRGRTTVKGR